jgi:hypothetical protein
LFGLATLLQLIPAPDARSKAFIILQMRDETYERYKNRPPLDKFRSGITFHIAPPRFIDVGAERAGSGIGGGVATLRQPSHRRD